MQKIFCILCLFAVRFASAQSVTGSWYGKADVEMAGLHSNYLTELVIKQHGNRVDGVFGYYFRDKYQSFFVHGRYNPNTREVTIDNIPVIYFASNSTVNSIDCNTSFVGVIMHSKVQSTIKGAFYHDPKYKYTCPDLKVVYTLDRDEDQDSTLALASVGSKVWRPQADDVVVDAIKTDSLAALASGPPPPVDTPVTAAVAKVTDTASLMKASNPGTPAPIEPVVARASVDTAAIAKVAARPAGNIAPVTIDGESLDKKLISESFAKRKEVLNKVLDVESDSVRVSFYDNGEIDGDSISVFVNKQVVLTHQELAAKALTMYLHIDSTRETNDISMYAENLGKYPPNTALMVVTDGKNRYEVFLSSTLTENATIQLRRKKPAVITTGAGRPLQ